jgi:hypothetical protein
MAWCIYKLFREERITSATGAFKINRDENWRLAKVFEGDHDAGITELYRLTKTDPEWRRWQYDDSVMINYCNNTKTIHRRMYHLIQKHEINILRQQIVDGLKQDGIDVQE